jgi:hypothetical protein
MFFLITGVITLTACQSATTIRAQDTPLPTATEPIPTQMPTQTPQNSAAPTKVNTEPPEIVQPASPTPPLISASAADLPTCEPQIASDESPATPSPQAGISVGMDSMIPPAPPAKVELNYSVQATHLTWGGTGTDVDQFYRVYLIKDGDECWQPVGVKQIEGDNKGGYQFEITNPSPEEATVFAVTTVDIYGNESSLSIAVLNSPEP